MKKTIFISSILLLFLTITTSAQKVKIKKGTVSIDKEPTCKVKKDNSVRQSFYINSLDDEELLYLKWVDWGQYGYFEIYKADNLDSILFERPSVIGFRKGILKDLYNAKALSKNGLDEKNLEKISKKFGREFSRKRSRY